MIKSARIKFDKLLGETPKACLILTQGKEHWIPKSLCRKFTLNNKLGGNVVLPTFIINKMFDIDINKNDYDFIAADYVVEHRRPKKIDFNPNNNPNESLIK